VNNELVVANFSNSSITVYNRTASGNIAPIRTLAGPATGLSTPEGLVVDTVNDELVVANNANNSVTVYSRTASGNTAPIRTLAGGATGLTLPISLVVDTVNNELVVANFFDAITVFSRTASGNTAPIRMLAGAATGLSAPVGLVVDRVNNELVVANKANNSVTVYSRTASGNTGPIRTLIGGATGLTSPNDLVVDTVNNELAVANFNNSSITVYSRTASGNTGPIRTLAGPATGLSNPSFIAATPVCVGAPSGMVAWWPMDEASGAASLQDIIGGNSATLFASPLGAAQAPQPVSGVVNGAIHFPKFGNGLSGARVSPQGALVGIGSADFTIDAWVEFQAAPANRLHYIVNRFDTVQNKGYALYVISPGIAGNERLEFKWGDGTNVSTVQTISTVTPGQFHHVAVTFARNVGPNALDIRLYVDGTQQGQQVGNPPGLGSLANFLVLEIGQQPGTIDEPITLDELEIFNVALSLSDIQSIYNAGSGGKCKCTTGGQSVDLTVASTGAVFGAGSGVGATVTNPLTVNYSIQGCSGHEMFLIVNASIVPSPVYFDGSAWVAVPNPLSLMTPFVTGGPQTSNGPHTLFNGSLPPGTYDVYLVCDLVQNGHLDVTFPPLCLSGAFDHLPLTVQ
jgi:6-phosphogluconolactonase (cycloisomerase 2 family)